MYRKISGMLLAAGMAALFGDLAYAEEFSTRLNGFQEIGGLGAGETGAILSDGKGTLNLDVGKTQITYTLTYSGLGSDAQQAHIHFGKLHVAGGIMVFFCSNLRNGPAGTPACPVNGGTVSGTLTAASVVGPVPQNVAVGDFDAVIDALNSNTAYANIHTTSFPGGEIRGQIRAEGDDED